MKAVKIIGTYKHLNIIEEDDDDTVRAFIEIDHEWYEFDSIEDEECSLTHVDEKTWWLLETISDLLGKP